MAMRFCHSAGPGVGAGADGIDCHRQRNVDKFEFVDRFHAEVAKAGRTLAVLMALLTRYRGTAERNKVGDMCFLMARWRPGHDALPIMAIRPVLARIFQ